MDVKYKNIIRWTLAIIFIVLFILFIFDVKWARFPFYLVLFGVSLYNLIFNHPKV